MTEENKVSKYSVDPELEKRRFPAGREDETADPLAQLAQDGEAEIKKAKGYSFEVNGEGGHRFAMRLEDGNPNGGNAKFRAEIAAVLNSNSRENISNTPDFILAKFMEFCLKAFEEASNKRELWYGKHLSIAGDNKTTEERIIDRLKEFDAINKVRLFTEDEGKEYSELMQQWATLVNQGKITADRPYKVLTFLDYRNGMALMQENDKGTFYTQALLADMIADGYIIQHEDGEILTPKEIGNIFSDQEPATRESHAKTFQFADIPSGNREGKMLLCAIAKIMEYETKKTPQQVTDELTESVAHVYHGAKPAKRENAGNKNYEKR